MRRIQHLGEHGEKKAGKQGAHWGADLLVFFRASSRRGNQIGTKAGDATKSMCFHIKMGLHLELI